MFKEDTVNLSHKEWSIINYALIFLRAKIESGEKCDDFTIEEINNVREKWINADEVILKKFR